MIYKSIKKNIRFGLLAIFGYYLVCLLSPTLANTQVSVTITDKQYIAQSAKDNLQKFQDKTVDSLLPEFICSSLEQYRELLMQATKIDKISETEIKELANECEKIFNNLHYVIQKEKINEEKTGRRSSLTDRLSRCEDGHTRCIGQKARLDWFGRFNCDLEASSCVFGSYVEMANDKRKKGGVPKD